MKSAPVVCPAHTQSTYTVEVNPEQILTGARTLSPSSLASICEGWWICISFVFVLRCTPHPIYQEDKRNSNHLVQACLCWMSFITQIMRMKTASKVLKRTYTQCFHYIYCICIMYINSFVYCFWKKSNLLYSPGLFGSKYSKNSIILWIIIIIKNNCYSVLVLKCKLFLWWQSWILSSHCFSFKLHDPL